MQLREGNIPGHLVQQAAAVAELHDEVELADVLEDGLERDVASGGGLHGRGSEREGGRLCWLPSWRLCTTKE